MAKNASALWSSDHQLEILRRLEFALLVHTETQVAEPVLCREMDQMPTSMRLDQSCATWNLGS